MNLASFEKTKAIKKKPSIFPITKFTGLFPLMDGLSIFSSKTSSAMDSVPSDFLQALSCLNDSFSIGLFPSA